MSKNKQIIPSSFDLIDKDVDISELSEEEKTNILTNLGLYRDYTDHNTTIYNKRQYQLGKLNKPLKDLLEQKSLELYVGLSKEINCDSLTIQTTLSTRIKHIVLSNHYYNLAINEGLNTKKGMNYLDMSLRLDKLQEKAAVTINNLVKDIKANKESEADWLTTGQEIDE